MESRILTRIKDGRSRDGDDEGTPVELSDMYCIKCGMHAGWQIVRIVISAVLFISS